MKNEPLLNYRIVGNGYSVLFLHGFLEDRSMWSFLTNKLPHHQLILIDLPGHGGSMNSQRVNSIPEMARAVARLLDELNIASCSCVGHSLGGYVGLELTSTFPSLISRLVLLNSHPWPDSPSKKQERKRVAQVVAKNKSLFLETAIPNLYIDPTAHRQAIYDLIKAARQLPKEQIIAVIHAMRKRSAQEETLKHKAKEALIIHGANDPLIDTNKIIKFVKKSGNNLTLLQHAGHMSHQESEHEVTSTLYRFLSLETDS